MFHTLNRLVVWSLRLGIFLVVVAVGWVAYANRQAFTPVMDAYGIWSNKAGLEQSVQRLVTGRCMRVLRADAFELRTPAGEYYTVRLTGLEVPEAVGAGAVDPAALEVQREAVRVMRELTGTNELVVKITYEQPPRNVLALVSVGPVNLNTEWVRRGFARARPEAMKGLPFDIQYSLVRSNRAAAAAGVGVWASTPPASATAPR